MKNLLLLATMFCCTMIVQPCFGQEGIAIPEGYTTEPPKRTAINAGVFMGGGGLVGIDLEFLVGRQIGLQLGAGFPSLGFALNYHFKPQINSSFVSLQYCQLGFGENNVASTLGPMFTFRAKKILQAGIGYGVVVNKGPFWDQAYKEDVSMLLFFNIGMFFPL